MFNIDILDLLIIFTVGVVSSSFGTLTGGGALITIPTLIFLGLPPHTAIGTSKLGAMGVQIPGWYVFNKKGLINHKIAFCLCVPALPGAILGANLVLNINETLLKQVIAVITILILAFVVFQPKIGVEKVKHTIKKREYLIGIILSFFIFVYTGFYGAGSGTFLAYALILLFGQTFIESAATRKIPSLIAIVMAFIIFAVGGAISYAHGIALFTGSLIGSYIGAHFSDKIGDVWIKKFFAVTVLIMAIKLLL